MVREAKKLGFSDKQIANAVEIDEDDARAMQGEDGDQALHVKAIDTLAAEWPARTNYLYVTYNASTDEAKPTDRRKVMVLGAGPVQDRELGRVRLGDDEHGVGAEGERQGRRDDRGELQPRDRLDRLRHERQALLRGAHRRAAALHLREGESRSGSSSASAGRSPTTSPSSSTRRGSTSWGRAPTRSRGRRTGRGSASSSTG